VRTYYDYDALGNLIRTGTVNEVKYQFTGQEYDESGVHNYRARLYDSDLGKFYAVDSGEEFASPFIYAGNDPVSYTDPSGNFISLAAFAYYAYQAYQYASYAYMAYNLVQATRQGGFGGFVQSVISIGAGAAVGGAASGLVGSSSLGGSILSGAVGGAAGGAASAYVMGSNVGTSSLIGAASGGLVGAANYGRSHYLMKRSLEISGYADDQPVEYSNKSLRRFVRNNPELNKLHGEGGKPKLSIADYMEVEGAKYNPKTGEIETFMGENAAAIYIHDQLNGVPIGNGLKSYTGSIYVGKMAFKSPYALYMTMGHELHHAIQYFSGYASKVGIKNIAALEYDVRLKWEYYNFVRQGTSKEDLAWWLNYWYQKYGRFTQ
ncbi:MAG: RHS repeat-associated core domain-containing protein, partial [Nitrososphaera sp.]